MISFSAHSPPKIRAQHYCEGQLFAGMFGIPRASLPYDYKEFTTYIAAMLDSDILTVGAAARMIAERIFAGS